MVDNRTTRWVKGTSKSFESEQSAGKTAGILGEKI